MADEAKEIDRRLAALAVELGLEEGLTLDEEDQCLIEIDGQALLLQHFTDPEIVVLHVDLGPLPEKGQDSVMRTLLTGNTSWSATGGGALGLAPESGHAVLMARLDLAEVDPDGFVDRVGDLIEAAGHWSQYLCEVAAPSAEGLDPELGLRFDGLIRA